jgi:hypothetical protein
VKCVLVPYEQEDTVLWLPEWEDVVLTTGDELCTMSDENGVYRAYVRRANGLVEEMPVERASRTKPHDQAV